ncbi:hypothetical protein XENOCAPTIV_000881 [Xenoophorus captivus]|uniref:Uncharacterized protein n=1 Tax=Xenoophorus captivus TaxID=1517983 RepID=A0ABV0SCK3_9TELE
MTKSCACPLHTPGPCLFPPASPAQNRNHEVSVLSHFLVTEHQKSSEFTVPQTDCSWNHVGFGFPHLSISENMTSVLLFISCVFLRQGCSKSVLLFGLETENRISSSAFGDFV